MAQQNRVTLQALIDLYITTNGNKEITGAQLNEVLTNLNDSAFLQLDEIRTALSTAYSPATPSDWNVLPTEVKAALDEAISRVEGLENAGFQTAVQTPYTATTSTDWDPEGAPLEVRGGLDILATRTSKNPSNDIAFVSDSGSDVIGEFEIGNPLKPFETIQAAITAIGSNGIVKALGGTYTETSIAINASNIFLDISNCTINSRIVPQSGVNNIIYAEGATINANAIGALILSGSDTRVFGGTWNGGASTGLAMQSTGGGYFEGCTFTSTGTDAANGYNSTFINCYFDCTTVSLNFAGLRIGGNNLLTTVKGGNITSSSSFGILVDGSKADIQGVQSISGNTGIAVGTTTNKIKIKNSKIKGVTQEAFRMNGNCEEVYLQGCELYGFTNCITYFVNVNRLNNEVNIFNNCYLLCGTGQIFTESYLGTDTGSAIASYCFINKALPVLTKITDNFITLDTGLQEF